VKIISGVPSGAAEDPRGAGPNNVDLVGGQAKFIAEELPLGLSVAGL
jgi:hypothetical protein